MAESLGLIVPNRGVTDAVDTRSEGERASFPDIVVNAIIRGVHAGRLVPGQRLVEADLTPNLGVSRGPVREALKRLAAEGIVTLNRHRGAFLPATTCAEAHDTLMLLQSLNR